MVYAIEGLEGSLVWGTQVLSDEVVEQEGLGVEGGRAVWNVGGEVRKCGMKGPGTANDYKPPAAADCE